MEAVLFCTYYASINWDAIERDSALGELFWDDEARYRNAGYGR